MFLISEIVRTILLQDSHFEGGSPISGRPGSPFVSRPSESGSRKLVEMLHKLTLHTTQYGIDVIANDLPLCDSAVDSIHLATRVA